MTSHEFNPVEHGRVMSLISSSTQIREHPLYHLIKAQTQRKMGQLQDSIQTLQMAMSLCGVRRTGSSTKRQSKKTELSSADCVSVYLELAEALWLNGEQVSERLCLCVSVILRERVRVWLNVVFGEIVSSTRRLK